MNVNRIPLITSVLFFGMNVVSATFLFSVFSHPHSADLVMKRIRDSVRILSDLIWNNSNDCQR